MRRSRIVACVLALCVLVIGLGAVSASAEWAAKTYQNASTAIPGATGDTATDLSSKVYRISSGPVRGSAVATASVTCDGCTADAVTMQVLYARNVRTIKVNNVAAAWSACTGCRGSALSLQVVLARSASQLTVNNRSLAMNASCTGCSTAAAAIQIVLISPKQNHPSSSVISSLIALRDQLHDQLVAALTQAPPALGRPTMRPMVAAASPVDATVAQLQSMLAADVHASSASHDIQLHRG